MTICALGRRYQKIVQKGKLCNFHTNIVKNYLKSILYQIFQVNILVQIQDNGKLFLTVSSLLLLVLVTYSGSFLERGLAASDTHIVASGDWHCTDDAATTVNVAKSLKPQLILGLGDYSSTETESCWVNLSKPVDSITKIAFGNQIMNMTDWLMHI